MAKRRGAVESSSVPAVDRESAWWRGLSGDQQLWYKAIANGRTPSAYLEAVHAGNIPKAEIPPTVEAGIVSAPQIPGDGRVTPSTEIAATEADEAVSRLDPYVGEQEV